MTAATAWCRRRRRAHTLRRGMVKSCAISDLHFKQPNRYDSALSRRDASEVSQESPSRTRGRRECRMLAAPAASRAKVKSTRASHHRFTETVRHSLRNGFNGLSRALPGDRALLPPSLSRIIPRKLDASVGAPGPHGFAVRDNAARRAALSRPPHPTSTFVTTRTSLLSRRDGPTQCR
jgi:hypothetical protein